MNPAGLGNGPEYRRPLGLTVGGLMVLQALTVYFTPVYDIYSDKLRSGMKRAGGQNTERGEGGEPEALATGGAA